MQFELPDLTPLILPIVAVIAVTSALLVAVTVSFVARNHRLRVARSEPIVPYYGHLLLGH